MDALSGLEVLLVCVTCPLAVAEQRELDRRNPNGLARGHHCVVHDHGTAYDMTVDSTTGTPAELARAVLRGQSVR
jgi:chloramphenicol 3-O phosphotransferase